MPTHLICTDLDRTLIPNGDQEESLLARARFGNIFKNPNTSLAYVSGRCIELVEAGIADYSLPSPNTIIADVGASIYHTTTTGWEPDSQWHDVIAHDWQGKSWQSLIPLLDDIDGLFLQDNQMHSNCPHKLSYYTAPNINAVELKHNIEQRLSDLGFRSRVIWSLDEQKNCGLLDIVPASVSKLHAIQFLIEQLGVNTQNCLFAGDSGNDLEALESNIPAVLVANATPDVRRQAMQGAKRLNTEGQLYLAQYQSENDNGNYAGGILQGIAHFFPELYSA